MERRNFSAQFKQQIVRECSETGNVTLVARKHALNANMVRRWIRQFNEVVGGKTPPKTRGQVTNVAPEELKQLQEERKQLTAENEQMKKTLGEQALEISILRDLLKKANPHLRIK
ncbi:transposase [Alicyclobacillus mengziensis]|uniref:Transposase n=1 Tax=Alicyclobacillus mengziensis TaxID=2931921 RepID=A0A9X7Z404_9BACL|nr:transposase [Alicyclobacillus mengziensis]QSO45469.1 transposase [Alicyclobacillus mengziensis]